MTFFFGQNHCLIILKCLNIYLRNLSEIFLDYIYTAFIFNNYPTFLYFGFFFFLTTAMSYTLLSYLGFYGVFILNLISLFLFWYSLIINLDFFFIQNNFFKIKVGKWMYLNNNYLISFDFFIDSISYSFMLLTVSIAFFVYIYTFSYFRYEPNVERLILFLNSFIISMVFLVISGNLIMLFLGWELIGITSFFLINFWSARVGTLKSAFKAYSFNKVSDFFLFFAILLLFFFFYTFDFFVILSQVQFFTNVTVNFFFFDIYLIDAISFCLLGAAFIKSAQLGAHIWLPDSMEAPVPASALIHSATLVSAGIYLLLRFSIIFELSTYAFYIIPLIGCFTALYGGLVAMYQSDTKRILAYSTISHCGFLMVVWTACIPEFTILYLYVHGFFKAAVFLCVGNIIRISRGYQDFRRMGLFFKYLPYECFASFICLINLGGLPFTFGFYIKHLLLINLNSYTTLYYIILVISTFAAFTGLFYSLRVFYYVFFDLKKAKKQLYLHLNLSNLKSKFYSNTSLASNIAITFIILVSYIICFFLFWSNLNANNISSDFGTISTILQADLYFYNAQNILQNSSFLNWFIIFLICTIIFSKFRKTQNPLYIYNFFFYLIVATITLFLFLKC